MTANRQPAGKRVVLLRAVNVGGAQLPMAELRSIAADLGATDVSTYIASGNLIATITDPADFDRALERAIEHRFGFFREAISRTSAELRAALDAHPFEVVEPKYSYVSFLSSAPSASAIAKAKDLRTGDDRWEVVGDDLHLRYSNGAGREQLRTATLMKALGVPGTARNLRTVAALADLAV